MVDNIIWVANEIHGDLKGEKHFDKETRQWGIEVKELGQEKRHCFKFWQENENMANHEMYKKIKK